MAKRIKNTSLLEQNSFLKGLMIGIGSTALFAGIGAFIAYQYMNLKRESGYQKKMQRYYSEENITPDSGLSDSTNPRFMQESEKLETDYEIRLKEFEEIEEATKHLRERI
ncbi:hypothetical protein KKB99_06475 [bacterium]|nr:hypothetical protein [bacterium]MBU1025634.1 hypothetical protein [bacterium]